MIPAFTVAAWLTAAPAFAQDAPIAPEAVETIEAVEPVGVEGDITPHDQLEAMRIELETMRAEVATMREALSTAAEAASLDAEVQREVVDTASRHITLHPGHGSVADVTTDEGLTINLGSWESFGSGPIYIPADVMVDEAVAFGSDITVEGRVVGDATSFGGNIRVRDGGQIDGDAVSFGGRVIVDDGGVVVGDRVNLSSNPGADRDEQHHGKGVFSRIYDRIVFLLSFAGAGVLVVGLFPNRVGRVAARIEERPIGSLIWGSVLSVVAFFSLLFAGVLTVLTVGIAIPIPLALIVLLGAMWLLGFVGLCQAIGDRLPLENKPHGRWLAFLVGVLFIGFMGMLPWVGKVVIIGSSVLGMGAVLTSLFGRR